MTKEETQHILIDIPIGCNPPGRNNTLMLIYVDILDMEDKDA